MIDWIQDKYQRFVLYMLDQFGIFVSSCTCLNSVILTLCFLFSILIRNNHILYAIDYATVIIIFLLVISKPSLQYYFENIRNFKKFEVQRTVFANSAILKYFYTIASFWWLALNIKEYYQSKDLNYFIIQNLAVFCFISYYFLMCCYTRDREPPMHAKTSFNPA